MKPHGKRYSHIAKILEKYKDCEYVLEIGCGIKPYRDIFLHNYVCVEKCGSKYANPEDSEIVWGDVHNLPFNDESFDLIFSVAVWYLFENPLKALKECYRVLKKKGIFLVFTYNVAELISQKNRPHQIKENVPKHIWSISDYKRNLKKVGFSEIRLISTFNGFRKYIDLLSMRLFEKRKRRWLMISATKK